MAKYSKSENQQLAELAIMAYEREQDSLLGTLASQFDVWRRKEITGEQLTDAIEMYLICDLRELWERLNNGETDRFVACAVAAGVLREDELPETVREKVMRLTALLGVNAIEGAETRVFQFKVTLRNTKPPIWRRIRVPASYSFYALHVAIQDAMGWQDCHLHQFEVADSRTGIPKRIGIPEGGFGASGDEELAAGWEVRLVEHFNEQNTKAEYWYDFGDDWRHTVVLEKVLKRDPDAAYPICTAGRRACPPEDCGGPWGYAELLAALSDPEGPDEEAAECLGEGFDPEAFDPSAVAFHDAQARLDAALDGR